MDLVRAAYSASDDEDEEDARRSAGGGNGRNKEEKRKLGYQSSISVDPSATPMQFSNGMYISKRKRAAQTSELPATVIPPPVVGSISHSTLPCRIQALLRRSGDCMSKHNRIPKGLSISLVGHTKAVNTVQWSPTHGHLLASGGMDSVAYIWNVWNEADQKKARLLDCHNAAIKDLQWSKQGLHLLTCGYDQTSRLTDVETGSQIQAFSEDQIVSVVKFHPFEGNLFISGGSKGALRLWDMRASKVIREYFRGLGSIMDVDFSYDGKHFVSSCDISQSNASEKSIVVWDFQAQVPLSNQVYVEAYTCPCVRYHPMEASFVAQSNGNYIAIFSSKPPFKLNKYKRFEKHEVSGFPVRCNFSQDGEVLVTGSADGCIYFYSYRSSNLLRRMAVYGHTCTDVVYHPLMPWVVASCSWDGAVSVFE